MKKIHLITKLQEFAIAILEISSIKMVILIKLKITLPKLFMRLKRILKESRANMKKMKKKKREKITYQISY